MPNPFPMRRNASRRVAGGFSVGCIMICSLSLVDKKKFGRTQQNLGVAPPGRWVILRRRRGPGARAATSAHSRNTVHHVRRVPAGAAPLSPSAARLSVEAAAASGLASALASGLVAPLPSAHSCHPSAAAEPSGFAANVPTALSSASVLPVTYHRRSDPSVLHHAVLLCRQACSSLLRTPSSVRYEGNRDRA